MDDIIDIKKTQYTPEIKRNIYSELIKVSDSFNIISNLLQSLCSYMDESLALPKNTKENNHINKNKLEQNSIQNIKINQENNSRVKKNLKEEIFHVNYIQFKHFKMVKLKKDIEYFVNI